MLFFSKDPVAVSSVMTDYIVAERGAQDHQQLHAAHHIGLGVHDHWDNFSDKQYALIDYYHFELIHPTLARADIDKEIMHLKKGTASEQDVTDLVTQYYEMVEDN